MQGMLSQAQQGAGSAMPARNVPTQPQQQAAPEANSQQPLTPDRKCITSSSVRPLNGFTAKGCKPYKGLRHRKEKIVR